MRAIIVAFDGLLCDTLGLRADAIVHAAQHDGVSFSHDHVMQRVGGRSLYECVVAAMGDSDPTACELITLRAQHQLSQRMSQGVSITANAHTWIEQQRRAGVRIVLRADALRRDVERVLRYTELEYSFTFVRCVDDLPRVAGKGSLECSYLAITARLTSLGISAERFALECDEFALDIARHSVDAVSLVTAL